MTHDPESEDFVIKRRRRRTHQTVLSSSSPPQEHGSSEGVCEHIYNTRSKARAKGSTVQSPVTVEDSLRRPAPTTGGEKKKRRYADLNNPEKFREARPSKSATKRKAGSSSDDEWIPHAATSTDAISSSSPLPRKKSGTLSERMLRAAALSHVRLDPTENLTHIVNPERPALHFEAVPSSTLESRLQLSVRKKWRLVDPRKAFNVRSEFGLKPSSTPASAPTGSRKSVGHWRPPETVQSLASQSTPAPRRERKKPRESQGGVAGPSSLTFVPIRPCSGTPGPSMPPYHNRTKGGLTSVFSPAEVSLTDIQDQQVLAYDSDTPQTLPPKDSLTRHPNDITPPDTDSTLPTNLSRLSRVPTLTQKPLKPFDSFLDGLMETARHATAVEKSKSRSRSSRTKPSTSSGPSMVSSATLRRKRSSRFPMTSARPVTELSLSKRRPE